MTEKRPPGTPPGVVKNPKGINQFTGTEQRGKALGFRLPIGLDNEFRRSMESRGITVTEALTEAIKVWLKNLL